MLVLLPKSERHPQTRLTVSLPQGEFTSTYDDSFNHVEVPVPDGVHENDMEIVAHYCNLNGEPDPLMVGILVKGRIPRDPAPAPTPDETPDANASPPDVGAGEGDEDDQPVSEAEVKQEEPAPKEVVDDEATLLAAWAAEEAAKHKPAE